jgi:hypothetical protein
VQSILELHQYNSALCYIHSDITRVTQERRELLYVELLKTQPYGTYVLEFHSILSQTLVLEPHDQYLDSIPAEILYQNIFISFDISVKYFISERLL